MRRDIPENTPTQIKLRLHYGLKRRLEQEATQHIRTLNDEVRIRLEASLEQDDQRSLEDVVTDLRRLGDSLKQGAERDLKDIISELRVSWGRFAARFLRMELADQLADSVLHGGNPEQAQLLAQLIVEQRSAEQHGTEQYKKPPVGGVAARYMKQFSRGPKGDVS